jgi:hypothetical protein
VSNQRLREAERAAATGDPAALQAWTVELERNGRVRLPEWGGDADDVWKYAQGFTREDVAETLASQPGENDGRNWVAVMRLFDGRLAWLSAGCDYTGWG